MSTSAPGLMPSKGIQDIASRAMLVNVTIAQFNPTKHDKSVTAEVALAHGSDVSLGKYTKTIISKSAVEGVRTLAGQIREEHYRRTLAWGDNGDRILTSTGFDSYAQFMRESETKWEAAVDKFLQEWDSHVEQARRMLNGLFNPADYPARDVLRAKFKFRWKVNPVPLAEDFRVALGSTEVAAIRKEMERDLQHTVSDAMRSVWTQMRDVVQKMVERLKAYNPQNPKEAPFRDSLVGNVADLLDMIPSLNLTDDPDVKAFTEDMRDLVKFDAQELRDNIWKREDVAKRAQSILDQMAAFVA